MANTEHIFTPKDDSLSERVRAYRSVSEAYRNAEASLKYMDDENWKDRLGEREEVEQAYEITRNSMHMATHSLNQDDIQQAKEQGLLSDDEISDLVRNKRQMEMASIRNNRQNSDSQGHSQKR